MRKGKLSGHKQKEEPQKGSKDNHRHREKEEIKDATSSSVTFGVFNDTGQLMNK